MPPLRKLIPTFGAVAAAPAKAAGPKPAPPEPKTVERQADELRRFFSMVN